jgi:hypothetical protein
VGDDAELQLFLVEHDLHGLSPAQLASAHLVLEEAVGRTAGRGGQIRYVQRILASGEPRCLCLFLAPGPGVVRRVNDIAQFPLARVVAVTNAVPHAQPQIAAPGKTIPMAKPDSPARPARPAHLLPGQQEGECPR